jgi:hypothetical protein
MVLYLVRAVTSAGLAPFVDDVARYETQEPYVLVDCSLRREHDALTPFPLLGFLPLMEW